MAPDEMRAAVLYESGPPSTFRLERIPVPRVAGDDVLVKVMRCGVSYHDVLERNGTYRRDVSYPLIMGLEISGEVVESGPDAVDLQPGDHVCSEAFRELWALPDVS